MKKGKSLHYWCIESPRSTVPLIVCNCQWLVPAGLTCLHMNLIACCNLPVTVVEGGCGRAGGQEHAVFRACGWLCRWACWRDSWVLPQAEEHDSGIGLAKDRWTWLRGESISVSEKVGWVELVLKVKISKGSVCVITVTTRGGESTTALSARAAQNIFS